MKTLLILAAALALTLPACNRETSGEDSANKSSAATGGSMETPRGAATGQASEGSTDATGAPKRPASK